MHLKRRDILTGNYSRIEQVLATVVALVAAFDIVMTSVESKLTLMINQ
jgi:hypothetical protein